MFIQNIVASTIFAHNLDLDIIAKSFEDTEYEPEQFPGLIYRLITPKTATLLFRSGKANCTGAKTIDDVRKTIELIAEKLKLLNIDVIPHPEIIIQNMVATADLGNEMNLNEVALTFGLDNVEYEPEQFPGLVYRVHEPRVVMLLFGSGKIVCTGGKTTNDVSIAVQQLHEKLTSMGLLH